MVADVEHVCAHHVSVLKTLSRALAGGLLKGRRAGIVSEKDEDDGGLV